MVESVEREGTGEGVVRSQEWDEQGSVQDPAGLLAWNRAPRSPLQDGRREIAQCVQSSYCVKQMVCVADSPPDGQEDAICPVYHRVSRRDTAGPTC